MSSSISILHVVESFGGGVATALAQYRSATPHFRHYLLRTERPGDFIESGESEGFDLVLDLPRSAFSAMVVIRRIVRELRPDVVHAHSSLAGLYVRLCLRSGPRNSIVYTPHGYAMERQDVSPLMRRAFGLAERVLARNTDVYAACSPREEQISGSIGSSAEIFYVPNVAPSVPVRSFDQSRLGREPDAGLVIATGRLTPARDPSFFASVVKLLQLEAPSIRFKWVGGGDSLYADELTALGVEVTGWLPRRQALEHLSEADVLMHTAAWDGFPMVLLEANALRVPSFVRAIPAFENVPENLKASSAAELAGLVKVAVRDKAALDNALNSWDKFLSVNTTSQQARRLEAAYRSALRND